MMTMSKLQIATAQDILHNDDCLDAVRYMYETMLAIAPGSAADDTQALYFELLAERNRQNEVMNRLNDKINKLRGVWDNIDHNRPNEYLQQVVEQYVATKQTEEAFHPVNIYKAIVKKHVPTQELHAIANWYRTAPHDLLKEALRRVEADHPQKPFGYLKKLMDTWIEADYRTLEDIQKADEHYKASRPTKQQQKASEKSATIRSSIEEIGHFKGIPEVNF